MGVVGYIHCILGIISNNIDNTADRIAAVKSGSCPAQDFDTLYIGDIDTCITVVTGQAFTVFQQ